MMTDGKDTLTYNCKKPPVWIAYKRKRLLPRKGFYQQDKSHGIVDAPTTEEKRKESTEGNKSEHPEMDTEHAPGEEVNKLLSNKCPESNISQKASEDQICPFPYESNSVHETSCSLLNYSSSDEKSTVTFSIPLPASCNAVVDPYNSSLKETGLSAKDKSGSLCMNATKERKISSPLITFQRRCKRKKDIDGQNLQNALNVHCDGTRGSASSASDKQGRYSERASEHALITSKNVESSYAGDRSSSESGSFTQQDHKMENILREDTSTIDEHPQITEVNVCPIGRSVGLDFPEVHTGNSSNDATLNPAFEPELFNNNSSIGKSQNLSSGLNAEKRIHEIPCARGSTKTVDLSIPAPVHDENSVGNTLDPPSGGRTSPLNDQSPGVKGLKLLNKNIGENHSPHQLLGNGCTSEEAVSRKHNVYANSSPADTLRNSYLQLFPEHSTHDTSRSTKMHQNGSASSGFEERTVNPWANSSQAGTAEANSSSLLGLFLPTEQINNQQNGSFPSSHWPNGGSIQSKEFFKDTLPQGFPVKPSTSMRHRMMLDTTVNKARTPKRNRSSGLHLYGHPTMWSDEELDCLWMGVRRYGKGNWEVMLKDPRLNFSPWRKAWDLAQQWEEEQAKLLSSEASSQGRQLIIPSDLQDSVNGLRHPMVGTQNLVEDVQLSLGGMFSKPKGSGRKRSQSNFMDIQNNATMQHQLTDTSTRTSSSLRRNDRRATLLHNRTQDVDSSALSNYSAYMPSGKDFPHWLKELAAIPLRPPQTAAASDTSAVGPLEIHHSEKGINHELGNRIGNKNTILAGCKLEIGAEAHNNIFPAVKDGQNKQGQQHPANQRDLIVIDSDASSEETISDYRGAVV